MTKRCPSGKRACQAEGKQVHETRDRKGLGLCEEQREAGAATTEPARGRRPVGEGREIEAW